MQLSSSFSSSIPLLDSKLGECGFYSGDEWEIGIFTDSEYHQRGFGTITAAALI